MKAVNITADWNVNQENDREIALHLGREVNINFTVRFSDKQVAFGRQKRETSTSR